MIARIRQVSLKRKPRCLFKVLVACYLDHVYHLLTSSWLEKKKKNQITTLNEYFTGVHVCTARLSQQRRQEKKIDIRNATRGYLAKIDTKRVSTATLRPCYLCNAYNDPRVHKKQRGKKKANASDSHNAYIQRQDVCALQRANPTPSFPFLHTDSIIPAPCPNPDPSFRLRSDLPCRCSTQWPPYPGRPRPRSCR